MTTSTQFNGQICWFNIQENHTPIKLAIINRAWKRYDNYYQVIYFFEFTYTSHSAADICQGERLSRIPCRQGILGW